MKLNQAAANLYIPDGKTWEEAAAGVTHLGIGAHPDDLEFMAYHGIEAGYGRPDAAFGGIICTDGGGSAREGPYAGFSDDDMKSERWKEQKAAASVGRYAFAAQLGYPSSEVKDPAYTPPDDDLFAFLGSCRPRTVYTHNPADKHATHVAVCLRVIRALRKLPPEARPKEVYGCEVWRDLDWMPDEKKRVLDLGVRDHLAAALSGCFDSQISGGKRYDLAVAGRRRAQATFLESHAVDHASHVTLAMDLLPLVEQAEMTCEAYVSELIHAFHHEVRAVLAPWDAMAAEP